MLYIFSPAKLGIPGGVDNCLPHDAQIMNKNLNWGTSRSELGYI